MFRVGGGPRSVADVTVAFRSVGEPLTPAGFVLMTIDPPGLGSQRSATTSRSAASILRRTFHGIWPPSGLMPSIFRSRRWRRVLLAAFRVTVYRAS